MKAARPLCLAALLLTTLFGSQAAAVRLLTTPPTEPGDPAVDFVAFDLTPDGSQVIASARFNLGVGDDFVYGINLPSDFSTTVTPTQLSTTSFLIPNDYDVDSNPVISPDGGTVLFVHDGRSPDPSVNTIHTMPIGGETGLWNGLFSGVDDPPGPNLVSPGDTNFGPQFSPNGNTIFFINGEAGYGGTIPTWTTTSFSANDPSTFGSVWGNPDWDTLYSVPAAGGTPVPITSPADGDIDEFLYKVTPDNSTVVFAPDTALATPRDRGDNRQVIRTVPAAGGASSVVPMAAAPNESFTISGMMELSPDGQTVYFVADYDTPGQNELYSLPLAGGTPTKINDPLHFAGDVRSFAISPDGQSVAYTAGKTVGSSNELWFKSASGAGTAVRINDPAPSNGGAFDVSNGAGAGQVEFSPDSQTVYYLGDMTTDGAVDFYAVDTTEKVGFAPSAYTYVGAADGDFLLATNWEDADGNNLPADISIVDNELPVSATLIVDGDLLGGSKAVTANLVATEANPDPQVQFAFGASLEIINGATVNFLTDAGTAAVDFDPGSGLKIVDSSLITTDDIFIDGTVYMNNGLLESLEDDLEFQDEFDATIINSRVVAQDNLILENSMTTVIGSTFETNDRLSLRYNSDLRLTDTNLDVAGDVEPVFTFSDGEGTSLILAGTSTLTTDSISEGTDLVLEDTAFASLGSLDLDPESSTANPRSTMTGTNQMNDFGYVGEDYASMIIVSSTMAEIELRFPVDADESGSPGDPGVLDVRDLIVNGLTGLTYNEDPSAWNVADWDGLSALESLRLAAPIPEGGDFNGDGVVDAADYTVWRDNLGELVTLPDDPTPGVVTQFDYEVWAANFGATRPLASAVPEPTALATLLLGMAPFAASRRRVASV